MLLHLFQHSALLVSGFVKESDNLVSDWITATKQSETVLENPC